MANPLSQFFETEERADGLYIKVDRGKKDSIQLLAVEKALQSNLIVNYDMAAIKQVVVCERGEFEKIGPPFEYYNTQFDTFIKIQITPLKAVIRVSSEAIISGIRPTLNMLYYALNRQGIVYGIKEPAILEFIANAVYDKDIVVAEGLAPEKGSDGRIELQVDLNPSVIPKVEEGGKVNYRDIKTFITVSAAQVLAKRIPPQQGKSGKSVTGEEIKSQIGNDVVLPAGKNTEISKDGQWLTSLKQGIVYIDNNLICVGEMLEIKGDVDFSVGNIKYTGNVMIHGNVRPGFAVESEGDIEIMGEVESAQVTSRKGHVTIHKGVIGKDDTHIFGAMGVTVGFAQGCTLKTDGKLTVDKYTLHCNLLCATLEANKPSSGVIGGKLLVYENITVYNLGNEKNVETMVCLADKNKAIAKEKLEELTVVKEKIQKQLELVSRELKSKTLIFKKIGAAATDRQRQELKKWVDSYNSLNMKVKYIEKKELEIQERINSVSNFTGFFKVNGTVYPGVKLDMYSISHKDIKTPMTNKLFRMVDCAIQAEG